MDDFSTAFIPYILFLCLGSGSVRADVQSKIVLWNDPVNISCPSYSRVQIRNISVLQDYNVTCPTDDCILDDDDLDILDNCKDSSSCLLNLDLPTNCSQEYGYMNITYTCKEETSYNCNFEIDFCNWYSENNTWQRQSGRYPNNDFLDHTTESEYGTYLYINGLRQNDVIKAELHSGYIITTKNKCLSIWYHMKGQQSLYVYQREWNHLDQPLWFANQHQTNMWISTNITLKPTKAYEIVITGHVKMGVIGVDDIRVFDGLCEETSQLTCDFEKNTCGFISNGTRNSIKWNREQGNNYRDHTTDTVYGYYMHIHNWYIMAWYSVKKGYLLSRRLTSKVSVCVTFWYYIYGDRVASFKFEKISTSPKSDLVRLIDISQHNEWHLHSLYVVGAEMFTLKFEASFIDNGWLSGIIIDDFTVTDGFCPGKQKIIHTCVPINKQFNIQECRGNDLIHKRLELGFQYRPAIANESTCSDIKTNIERRIEKFCQNSQPNRVNYCTFMPFEFLVKWNMCFVVNNTKQLHLYYSCADSLSSPTSTNPIGTVTAIQQPKKTDVSQRITVAVICGIVFTTVLIAALSCLIRRSKRIKRKVPNQGMIVFLNTRSEHQNAVLSLVSDHLSKNDKGIYGKKNCNGEQFDLEESRCNHKPGSDTQIQKEKLISSHVGQEIMRANINVIDKKMKKVDVNMQIKLAATPVDDYAILDPTKTGFNRSECNYEGNRNYQIAMSSITSKEKESDMQDPYVLSETETYDSSANIRHKETDTNIYSHTVDNVYDTTAHERRIEDTESTYDHFFGEQTEDVYDIAKRDQHKLYLTQNKYPSPHQI